MCYSLWHHRNKNRFCEYVSRAFVVAHDGCIMASDITSYQSVPLQIQDRAQYMCNILPHSAVDVCCERPKTEVHTSSFPP